MVCVAFLNCRKKMYSLCDFTFVWVFLKWLKIPHLRKSWLLDKCLFMAGGDSYVLKNRAFAMIGYIVHIFHCGPCFALESLENSFSSSPVFFSEILDSRAVYFLFPHPLPPGFFAFFLGFCFFFSVEQWFFYMLCQVVRRYLGRTN